MTAAEIAPSQVAARGVGPARILARGFSRHAPRFSTKVNVSVGTSSVPQNPWKWRLFPHAAAARAARWSNAGARALSIGRIAARRRSPLIGGLLAEFNAALSGPGYFNFASLSSITTARLRRRAAAPGHAAIPPASRPSAAADKEALPARRNAGTSLLGDPIAPFLRSLMIGRLHPHKSARDRVKALNAGLGDENHFAGLHAGRVVARDHVGLDHDDRAGAKRLVGHVGARPAL